MGAPRTTLPNARQNPRFSGVSTFCRFPRVCDVPETQRPIDWLIYGVPFDSGVTYRPGARFGPRAVREASQYIKPHNPELGVTITEVFSLADGGDAPTEPYSCGGTADSVADYALGLGDGAATKLFAVGGDHSIALANIRATWERRGKPAGGLAVLHFDAHLDTVDAVWGETHGHASPFIRAIEAGYIDPKRMLSVGIRGPLNTACDLQYARDNGVRIVTADAWRKNGLETLAAFVQEIDGAEAYLSWDIDVVDPAYAPGTGTPCCGGLTGPEALTALRSLAGSGGGPCANIVGADVVEVLPDRDVSQITALLASHVLFEVLSIDAVRASRG